MTDLLVTAIGETLYMVIISALCAFAIGLPLGIVLYLKPSSLSNKVLGLIVNIGRSIPFAILMVALIPFTRQLVGTSIGTTAAIVPLAIAAIPFVARVVEGALKEVDPFLIEVALVMGSSTWQIVTKVLLREALPALISGATLTLVNLIGYSAMAGLVGGGGLGKVAIQYGYQRFNPTIMVVTVALLVIIVQAVEITGSYLSNRLYKKWRA